MKPSQDSMRHQEQHQIDIAYNQTFESHLNLPPRDGRRQDFIHVCAPLYKAATRGDQKAVKTILDKCTIWVRFSITETYETLLHIAALGKSPAFVEYLITLLTKEDLELVNANGETALCLAAIAGDVEIAKILVTQNERLLDIPDSRGNLPFYIAAIYGNHDMLRYLYHSSNKMTRDFWTNENRGCVLVKCVEANMFDVALEMVTDNPKLATNGTVLELLARKPKAFDTFKPHFLKRIIYSSEFYEENHGLQLLRIILTEILKLPKAELDDILRGPPGQTKEYEKETHDEKSSSRVLFLAAEMGNTIVVKGAPQAPRLRG